MRTFLFILLSTAILVTAGLFLLGGDDGSVGSASGPLVTADPIQAGIEDNTPWMKNTYRIIPLARYDITAQVLSIEYYHYGREANLSPVDFALGWGPMSDPDVTKHFTVKQHDRWSSWRSEGSPIPTEQVLLHSANVHMVPPNEKMMAQLGRVKVGDVVRFTGKLIEAQGSDGWTWTSSLVRDDQGERSCEIIWVEHLEILSGPAQSPS